MVPARSPHGEQRGQALMERCLSICSVTSVDHSPHRSYIWGMLAGWKEGSESPQTQISGSSDVLRASLALQMAFFALRIILQQGISQVHSRIKLLCLHHFTGEESR